MGKLFNMATKTKSKKEKVPKKKKKLNEFTEKKNIQPLVEVEKVKIVGEETELPETRSIVPIREFAMPIARPEQLQKAMELYQQCVNSLIKSSDIVLVEGKPHGKKIAVNKINRVFGVSTEVIRSFQEEHIANKDYWSKGFQKVILVHKGEKFMVAKAWVKAILPNGQFCTRGGAVSETERRFAHFPHDLIATAETRAMKNAAINLLGVEFEMMEEENGEEEPPEKPKEKTYKPELNQEQGYKHSGVVNPKMSASPKQKNFIQVLIDKLKNDYEVEIILEKPIEKLNKGEAADLINKLMARGKEVKKKMNEKMASQDNPPEFRKEIPLGEPPTSPSALGKDEEKIKPSDSFPEEDFKR